MKQHIMPRWFRWAGVAAFVLIVIALVVVPGGGRLYAEPAGAVTMRVDPATRAVPVNGQVMVRVVADLGSEMNTNGLGAYEFDATYDSDYLSFVSVADAGGLGSTGRTVEKLGPIDVAGGKAAGAYSYDAVNNPQLDGPKGNNIALANVTLNAKKAGVTTLDLANALMVDTQANAWPDAGEGRNLQVVSGTIQIHTFLDVLPSHWAVGYIEKLAEVGITSGCGGGKYCPDWKVARDQMAVFLIRAMGEAPVSPTGVFSDVPPDHWAAGYIERLAELGITSGCGGGNFCPDWRVARDQMAVFLIRMMGEAPVPPTGVFSDVPPDHWAAGYIERLAELGITSGCGGGNFCPDWKVARDQMAVFLIRAIGETPVPF